MSCMPGCLKHIWLITLSKRSDASGCFHVNEHLTLNPSGTSVSLWLINDRLGSRTRTLMKHELDFWIFKKKKQCPTDYCLK